MATNYRDKIKKSTGFRFNLKTINLFRLRQKKNVHIVAVQLHVMYINRIVE